jgi:hypothetical protein
MSVTLDQMKAWNDRQRLAALKKVQQERMAAVMAVMKKPPAPQQQRPQEGA